MQATKSIIITLIIIGIAFLAKIFAGILINTFVKRFQDNNPDSVSSIEKRAQTLGSLFNNIVNVLIVGTAAIMIMSEWGINIAPIITGAGIIGLAVGFGSQALVKDIVTGFFVLFENQYNVGDKVKIAGIEGTVIEMNLRTTVIKGENDRIIIIPNSQVTTIEKI